MTAVWVVAVIVGVYIVFAGYLYIFQSSFIYYPERDLTSDPRDIGLPFENVSFETNDGLRLSGWFVPKEDSRGVILFCHGNAGNIGHRLDSIRLFNQLGLEVFIFDYRGYGESEGKPSEQGTYEDVKAAWEYLVEERQIEPGRIVVFGRSLGGAIASWLASGYTPGTLILESVFTSLPDVAATHYPYMPVRLMLRFKYDTAEYLSKVSCPVLIIHSRGDEITPFSHGQKLFEIGNRLELDSEDIDGLSPNRKLRKYIYPLLALIIGGIAAILGCLGRNDDNGTKEPPVGSGGDGGGAYPYMMTASLGLTGLMMVGTNNDFRSFFKRYWILIKTLKIPSMR